MDTRTRPKRTNRVVVEDHGTYSFYLPVKMMEEFRVAAEVAGRPYSEYATEAITLFLAKTVHVHYMQQTNGSTDDR